MDMLSCTILGADIVHRILRPMRNGRLGFSVVTGCGTNSRSRLFRYIVVSWFCIDAQSLICCPREVRMKSKWKKILDEYGRLAIIVHLSIFFLSWAAFFGLIQLGFKDTVIEFFQNPSFPQWLRLDADQTSKGTLILAYGVTRLVSPIRIALTASLVPLIARRKAQSK